MRAIRGRALMWVGVLWERRIKSSCEGRLEGGRQSGVLAFMRIVRESRVKRRQLWGNGDRGVN